jgi:hypothetical protein
VSWPLSEYLSVKGVTQGRKKQKKNATQEDSIETHSRETNKENQPAFIESLATTTL